MAGESEYPRIVKAYVIGDREWKRRREENEAFHNREMQSRSNIGFGHHADLWLKSKWNRLFMVILFPSV